VAPPRKEPPKRKVVNRGLGAKVYETLDKQRGLTVYREDMARDLGVNSNAIIQAVNTLRRNGHTEIEVVMRGNAWRIGADKKTQHALYEQIGVTKSGDLILQDEEGQLYRAREID